MPGFSRYEVSRTGQVRSRLKSGVPPRLLRPGVDSKGYRRVLLYNIGQPRKSARVHQLVANAFLRGTGHHIKFRDGNKLNAAVSNLQWVGMQDVGVGQDPKTGNWYALGYRGGQKFHLGYFPTKEEAREARSTFNDGNY